MDLWGCPESQKVHFEYKSYVDFLKKSKAWVWIWKMLEMMLTKKIIYKIISDSVHSNWTNLFYFRDSWFYKKHCYAEDYRGWKNQGMHSRFVLVLPSPIHQLVGFFQKYIIFATDSPRLCLLAMFFTPLPPGLGRGAPKLLPPVGVKASRCPP